MEAPETELKFELEKGALTRLRKHPAFAAQAETRLLISTYFDTEGGDLRRGGFGLRIREADGGYVQTLKQQKTANPIDRHEWESEAPGGRLDPAALADTPAAGLFDHGASSLAPRFATRVERISRLWSEGPNLVELSLDRGEITAGQTREPILELELELKAGDPAALFDLARTLTDAASLRLSFDSKAERGYRLAAGEGRSPRKAQPGGVLSKTPAADAFRQVGWSCLAQVATNVDLLRRRRSVEGLHQARVGLRRFRAALTTFQPMLADAGFDDLKAETKWLAGELDGARDLDVFIHVSFHTAQPATEDRPAYAQLGARLLATQTEAYERALAATGSPRYAVLLLKAAAWLEVGAWTRSNDPVLADLREQPAAEFARERLDRLRRQVVRPGRDLADLDPASRHRLRIKTKKLRYAAEFFADSFGPGAAKKRARLLGRLETLQDRLGELNDIVVGRRLAGRLLQDQSNEVAFAAGLIVGARQGDAGPIGKAAVKAFAAFEDAKPFWR